MKPVVFIDRDGVINQYPGHGNYVTNQHEFKFIPGSLEAIGKLSKEGFKLYIISNQAGVAKGLYTQKDLDKINAKILQSVKKVGGNILGIYYCTHLPSDDCDCRKPKAGLLKKAQGDSSVFPDESFFIGDSFMDMKAARNFGAKSVLVLSGREKISNRDNWEFEPDYVFDNLLLAAHYIISHNA